MAKFVLHIGHKDGCGEALHYDTADSSLCRPDGETIDLSRLGFPADPDTPLPDRADDLEKRLSGKKIKNKINVIRLKLGLRCNYSCQYCMQRNVPRTEDATPDDIDPIIQKLSAIHDDPAYDGEGLRIEFWGGEPFVYWKTLKPLAEKLRAKYPKAQFLIVSNGSLLDEEKALWLERLEFNVGLSHDGPGQAVRGADPLDDPVRKAAILDLYKRLSPKGRMSFNPTLNRLNLSRSAIYAFFRDLTGNDHVALGEGRLINVLTDSGVSLTPTLSEQVKYRHDSFLEMCQVSGVSNFLLIHDFTREFFKSVARGHRLEIVPQGCTADNPRQITVDIKGNVLTCNNVSASDRDASGLSHRVGTLDDFDGIRMNTSLFFTKRKPERCLKCPVVHLCKGGCALNPVGKYFDASCANFFSDCVVSLAWALLQLTGGVLTYIDGENLPENRKDIFGLRHTPEASPLRKIIPIRRAA
jgi:uncharacterized protein